MPEGSDLEALLRAVGAADVDAVALAAPLNDAQANWQPRRRQRLERGPVSRSSRVEQHRLRVALPAGRRACLGRRRPSFSGLRPTWLGRWFGPESLEPPPRHRMKTFKNLVPPSSMPLADALAAYLASHDQFGRLLTVAGQIDTNRVVTSNPFVGTVRMRLSTALLVVPAHDRRHLWQARQVLAAPGFPRA